MAQGRRSLRVPASFCASSSSQGMAAVLSSSSSSWKRVLPSRVSPLPAVEVDGSFERIQGPLYYAYDAFKLVPRDEDDLIGYTAPSSDCAAALCVDDLVVGDLVVTEVMFNPNAGDDAYNEWLEVFNASGSELDLAGLVLTDADLTSGTVDGPLIVAAGDFVVLAKGSGTGWAYSFSPDGYWGGSPALSNSADYVVLSNSLESLDATANWEAAGLDAGQSWQLDRSSTSVTSNDLPSAWCAGSTAIGSSGDSGSPGSRNGPC